MAIENELILVCNAHLDPVWLWEWEEGVAETLSTFRTAVTLCREFKGFVFNHNEALLYSWIEEHDADLFADIRELVMAKKWHVMGGWYLQPDCNLPAGEGLLRQILAGRRYFRQRFGVEPETAVNLDSFGHSRGLVQLLCKSGYSSYLFCRPSPQELELPADDFTWLGYDGSQVLAHRSPFHYNSDMGRARERVEKWLADHPDKSLGLLLWGVGDHGGGPSRRDLADLTALMAEDSEWSVRHGTPERYFRKLAAEKREFPRHAGDLNPWAVGCYTSMALLKQRYRRLENLYFATEKMVTSAAMQGLLDYPGESLSAALEDLLFCQFHDIVTGDATAGVEAASLQRLDHGLEVLSRIRLRAFLALLSGQKPAAEGEFSIFVYNPHPFPMEKIVECEFQPLEVHRDRATIRVPVLADQTGSLVPSQLEKEESNIADDWRKRVAFQAQLQPACMNRFNMRLELWPRRESAAGTAADLFSVASGPGTIAVDPRTGLLDTLAAGGRPFLLPGAGRLLVCRDDADPWGMRVRSFRQVEEEFQLQTPEEGARFAGVSGPRLEPVRVIEDGSVRRVIEALFAYRNSAACIQYKIPRQGGALEIVVRIFWQEKDRMLKLSLPSPWRDGSCRGQVAYGVETFAAGDEEHVAQKWLAVTDASGRDCLTVVNEGTYGFDFAEGELRLSLLRSAAHAAHPVAAGEPLVPQDRFTPRLDQGERIFRFWIQGGPAARLLAEVDRFALACNEKPYALCCYPSGAGKPAKPGPCLSDESVQITACKKAEDGTDLIVRLFEPSGQERRTVLFLPFVPAETEVHLTPFEVKTLRFSLSSQTFSETDMLERNLK